MDRVVGSAFPGEHCGADELPQELAAEQPVVIQLLVSAFEDQDIWRVGSLAVPGA